MLIYRALSRYRRLDTDARAVHREALRELTRASVLVHVRPFGTISRHLERHDLYADPPPAGGGEIQRARELGTVVARVARNLFWKPPCLPQVLALQAMMERRSIPGAFYLGASLTAPDRSVSKAGRDLVAHAWLRCGSQVVNGGARSAEIYPVLATFSWR